MFGDFQARKVLEDIEERLVGALVIFNENGIEVANRLMIVRGENEIDFFHVKNDEKFNCG